MSAVQDCTLPNWCGPGRFALKMMAAGHQNVATLLVEPGLNRPKKPV
jgi:hypothetical protein